MKDVFASRRNKDELYEMLGIGQVCGAYEQATVADDGGDDDVELVSIEEKYYGY